MKMSLLFLALVFVAIAQQPEAERDPKELLLTLRAKVVHTVERLPKYLCTETVDRTIRLPQNDAGDRSCDDLATLRKRGEWKLRKHTSDRLRLDVAVTSDAEMYSWVGEDRFENRSLADLANGGATSTGMFASFLGSIFGTNEATFTYDGDVTNNGQSLVQYGFRVSADKSRYLFGNKTYRTFVAYDGTFLVDPKNTELVTLTIHAAQLPSESTACESTTTLDYGTISINGFPLLIPNAAQWDVFKISGSELNSRATFSACHEFTGKSTLRFDDSDESPQDLVGRKDIRVLELPYKLPFTIVLTAPINTSVAAAGDLFQARLKNAIRGNHHEILVPEGSPVTGRILRIQRSYSSSSPLLLLGLKLETIEIEGKWERFNARLESMVKRRQKLLDALRAREDLGSFETMAAAGDPDVNLIEFEDVTSDYVIGRGFEIAARTVAPQ